MPARAQEEGIDLSLPALIERAETFLDENLRDGELTLPEPDPAQMDDYFRELLGQLEGEYVIDLLPLKRTADFLLPLLEAHEPLRDLGAWLRSRRDYFDVLDTLTVRIPGVPGTNAVPTVPAEPSTPDVARSPIAPKPGVPTPRPPEPAVPAGPGLSNRVTVEVATAAGEPEPVPIRVVVVPPPRGATKPAASPPAPTPPPPPSVRRENPAPEVLRGAWTRQVAGRPAPPASGRWVRRLKPLFVAAGIPAELVWLAEVESGFDPRARSPSGAVGMYQLMPVTARSLGLGTFPFDERKNPEKCAQAAARYLAQLRDQFGDWPLALAAYNAGPARVRSLLTDAPGTTFASISRRLPVETQLYVPKFAALLEQREGRRLEDLPVNAPKAPKAP